MASVCFRNGCSFLSPARARRIKIVVFIPDFYTISSFFTCPFPMLDCFSQRSISGALLCWLELQLWCLTEQNQSCCSNRTLGKVGGAVTKFPVDVAHCCRPVQHSAETLESVLQEPDNIKIDLFCSRLCWLIKENRHGCVHLNLFCFSFISVCVWRVVDNRASVTLMKWTCFYLHYDNTCVPFDC